MVGAAAGVDAPELGGPESGAGERSTAGVRGPGRGAVPVGVADVSRAVPHFEQKPAVSLTGSEHEGHRTSLAIGPLAYGNSDRTVSRFIPTSGPPPSGPGERPRVRRE